MAWVILPYCAMNEDLLSLDRYWHSDAVLTPGAIVTLVVRVLPALDKGLHLCFIKLQCI